jgi:hypothetical protein
MRSLTCEMRQDRPVVAHVFVTLRNYATEAEPCFACPYTATYAGPNPLRHGITSPTVQGSGK